MSCAGCSVNFANINEEIGVEEKDCIEFFRRHGVLRRVLPCPACGAECSFRQNPPSFRCQKSRLLDGVRIKCKFERSLKTNSWLAQAILPYYKVIKFIAAWCTVPHLRHSFFIESMGMSSKVVVNWSYFCREICVDSLLMSDVDIVGGPGMTVEVNEAKLGRKKHHVGGPLEGRWVFGVFERETKRCFFERVHDRKADTLLDVIERRIAPGTTIMSDLWRGYKSLNAHLQYQHLTANQSMNFIDIDSASDTQNIKQMWRELWSKTPEFGSKKEDSAGYLAEFYWKRKTPSDERVHQLLQEIARQFPP